MGPAIRPARPDEASSLALLSLEVWSHTYLRQGVGRPFADYALSTFTSAAYEQIIADPRERLLVSDNLRGLDGLIRVTRGNPAPVGGCHDIEITSLYVQPRHHGNGIGSALLRAGMAVAVSMGAASVWLSVNAENTRALGFYRAHGFECLGQTAFIIDGIAYPNDVLRCRLPS